MTVTETEIKTENTLQQDKVDTNVSHKQVDTKTQQQNETPSNNTQAPKASTDTPAEDPNWRAFREARKKDRAEREAAERRAAEKEAEVAAIKAAFEASLSKVVPPSYNQNNENYQTHEETEDERIEKKVQIAIAAREAAAEKARIEREHLEYPQRLTRNYPDFNQTISQENLDYLDYHYPEVSRPLQRLQDGFDKWSDIYAAIKKFVPNNVSAKKEAARADANFAKPKSISSPSITQPGEAIGGARITEERRAENWARMQKILKGVS